MATNETDLVIRIKLIDDLTTKLNKISDGIKNSSLSKLSNQMSSIGKTMTMKITAPFALLATLAGKATLELEDLTRTLNIFTRDASKTEEVIKQIQGLELNKVIKTDEIERAAQQLLLSGTKVDDLMSKLNMVGKISLGANLPMEEIIKMYANIMQKGKASVEELAMLGRRGVPVIETIRNKLGVTDKQFSKMAKNFEIGSGIIDEAFKEIASNSGIYGKQIDANMNDYGSSLVRITNSLKLMLRSVQGAFASVLKDIEPFITSSMEKIAKAIKKFTTEYPMLTKIVVIIGAITAALGPLLMALAPLILALTTLSVLIKSGLGFSILARLVNPIFLVTGGIIALTVALDKLFPKLQILENMRFGASALGKRIGEGWDWVANKLGFGEEKAMPALNQSIPTPLLTSATKGQTDVNIKLSMPEWMQSNITGINKKGKDKTNVNIFSESYLGPSFNIPGVK